MTQLDPNLNWSVIALLATIQSQYPQLMWAIHEPELLPILMQAAKGNWDQGRIQGALEATTWWKTHNANQRKWQQLVNEDPAEAQKQRDSLSVQIGNFAAQSGVTVDQNKLATITEWAVSTGATPDMWQARVAAELGGVGANAPSGTQLKQIASSYAIPLSDATMAQWEQQIISGKQTVENFRAYAIEQAKSLFPGLTAALDSGQTVSQYVSPYEQIAQQELGINPGSIDWRDPKWNAAIHQIDPKTGAPVSMSLSDWTSKLRTDPTYGFNNTQGAAAQATNLAQAIQQRFGAVK